MPITVWKEFTVSMVAVSPWALQMILLRGYRGREMSDSFCVGDALGEKLSQESQFRSCRGAIRDLLCRRTHLVASSAPDPWCNR